MNETPNPTRVLFARIGWMTYYDGPQPGDERPKGGGAYNRKNIGHEVFNFAEFGGCLYGFVRTKSGYINLARIEPSSAGHESLDDVLVIFVAGQHVVGWYRKATVHATNSRLPVSVAKEMTRRLKQSGTKGFEVEGHRFEAKVENAVLLPLHERNKTKWGIPGNVKGGFGEYNIRYPYRLNHASNYAAWMNKATQYVLNYSGSNLLNEHYPDLNPEEAAAVAQEKGQGFHSDPRIRRIIEEHAMNEAKKELKREDIPTSQKRLPRSLTITHACETENSSLLRSRELKRQGKASSSQRTK